MTHPLYNKETFLKILVLLMLIIIPFSLSDYSDNVVPEKITSDLKFYEINTCSISLNEFLLHNPNVIYQDHYKIRFNNYSSINCFGQITGIDQIGHAGVAGDLDNHIAKSMSIAVMTSVIDIAAAIYADKQAEPNITTSTVQPSTGNVETTND